MSVHRLMILVVVLSTLLANSALGQGRLYRLEAGSNRQEGCFAPCLCPIFIAEDLAGTFVLTEAASSDRCTRSFSITNVNWVYSTGGADVRLTGAGTYEIYSCGPWIRRSQRLTLDLSEDGGRPRRFDSGIVAGGNSVPMLDISVALNGFYCYDTAYHVVANPVSKREMVSYNLHRSEYVEGCYAPCLCPIRSWDAAGSFVLVDINTNPNPARKRYAVVNFQAETVGQIDPPDRAFSGFGIYSLGLSDQRLVLDVQDAVTGHLRLDSGIVVYSGGWPEINIDLSDNGFFCFNHAFNLHARP